MSYSVISIALASLVLGQTLFAADEVSFRRDVAPILRDNCLACHGPKKAEGGYRVDSYAELLKPGDSGEIPVSKSTERASELLARITSQDDSIRMPAETEPLTQQQIQLVRTWIEGGATFDGVAETTSLSLVIPPPKYPDPPRTYVRPIPITALAFSPDGTQLLSSGYHEVTVWNVEDHQLVRRISNMGQRVFGMAFSEDAEVLAIACGEPGKNGEVRLVDFSSGEIRSVVARSNDVAQDVAFRPGSHELAVAAADSFVRIVNYQSQEEVRTIASHADWVTSIAWSDDGSRLVSGSRDKSVKVYDAATGELLSSYLGHGAAVAGVAFTADGKHVVSTGADNKLHRWDVETSKKVAEVSTGGQGFQLFRTGQALFVPTSGNRLLSIDLTKNAIAREFLGHNEWVISVAGARDTEEGQARRWVASGSLNGEVRIWNVADGSVVQAWTAKP